MLDRNFTTNWRTILSVVISISILVLVIVANVENAKTKKNEKELKTLMEQLKSQDSLHDESISEMQKEFETIKNDVRFIEIIGAYTIINTPTTKPTKKNVEDLVSMCGCWYPDIVMAQYQLESSCGRSNVANKNNNLFGMKKAFQRRTVRCRTFDKKGYAVYNNWPLSVIDRILWEEEMFTTKPTRAEYLKKIKSIYAEDTKYIEKILEISKNYSYLNKENA